MVQKYFAAFKSTVMGANNRVSRKLVFRRGPMCVLPKRGTETTAVQQPAASVTSVGDVATISSTT